MLKGRDVWWEDEIKNVESQGIQNVEAVEIQARRKVVFSALGK